MSPDQLAGDRLDDVGKGKGAGFLGHAGVIDDLKEEIAELIAKVGEIVADDGLGYFVGFLDRVRRDGREALLLVPRAAALRVTERRHDLDQPRNIARGFHRHCLHSGYARRRVLAGKLAARQYAETPARRFTHISSESGASQSLQSARRPAPTDDDSHPSRPSRPFSTRAADHIDALIDRRASFAEFDDAIATLGRDGSRVVQERADFSRADRRRRPSTRPEYRTGDRQQ